MGEAAIEGLFTACDPRHLIDPVDAVEVEAA